MDFKFIKLHRVDSTNDYAQEYVKNFPQENNVIFMSNEQTKGKGQRGNSWFSEKNKNLTFSILIKEPEIEIFDFFSINFVVSLALIKLLKKDFPKVKIKWPNDILIDKKKTAGILIENSVQNTSISQTIIGIGLNVNQAFFPKELPLATSMTIESNKIYDLDVTMNNFIQYFNFYWKKRSKLNILKEKYLNNLFAFKQWQEFKDKNGFFRAQIIDIEKSGELVVLDEKNEIRKYFYKEVEFILKDK